MLLATHIKQQTKRAKLCIDYALYTSYQCSMFIFHIIKQFIHYPIFYVDIRFKDSLFSFLLQLSQQTATWLTDLFWKQTLPLLASSLEWKERQWCSVCLMAPIFTKMYYDYLTCTTRFMFNNVALIDLLMITVIESVVALP